MNLAQTNWEIMACPKCQGHLEPDEAGSGIVCSGCRTEYVIENGIPRFVPRENYTGSFGFQWNRHKRTQLDKFNGLSISRDRLLGQSRWSAADLDGMLVLECGSGAGRFSQVLLDHNAELYSIDYSDAVEANYQNNGESDHLHLFQASIYELPFKGESFDRLICLGVIQHTPDVEATFKAMFRYLKKGGKFCIDVYAAPHSYLHPRHLIRPFTRNMDPEKLYRIVEKVVPWMLPLSTALHRIPLIGQVLARLIPVANWRANLPLKDETMWKEWAVLDTFDWLSPAYESPQSAKTLEAWCRSLDLGHFEVIRERGLYVVRGTK